MKVIFDAEIIGKNYRSSETGIYRVATELLKGFYENPNIDLAYINHCYYKSFNNKLNFDDFLIDFKYDIKKGNNLERRAFLPFRKEKLFKSIYSKFGINDFIINYDVEVMLNAEIYHSVYSPISESLNQFPNIKKVITIHDLIPLLFPQYAVDFNFKNIISSITHDVSVICVSHHTKKDLLKLAPNIAEENVYVSHLAASKDIFYVCDNKEKFAEVKQKYNLPDRYFLSLSTLEPRKNIDFVIRNFIDFIKENNIDDMHLVLVGGKGWNYDNIFEAIDNAEHFKNKIILTGHVANEDLASIYSNAHSFYYMSFYEGFGLPPLEAMQCGLPVVVSNTSSLPEVVGDNGILLDPRDSGGLKSTMLRLYTDEKYRENYIVKSLQQAEKFSWKNTIDQHIEIYQSILKLK